METTLSPPVLVRGLQRTADASAVLRAEDFDQLVRLHQQRIFRLLMTLVRDADAADTLTQECFLRAFRKRASFRGECKVETWLWRIAIHLAADHRRSRRTAFWRRLFSVAPADGSARDERMQAVAAANPSPERAAIARQEAALAWAAADRLPSQQRTIFLLRFAEEMSLDEIAVALGLEVGTVKAHLHRAVVAVRKALRPGETP